LISTVKLKNTSNPATASTTLEEGNRPYANSFNDDRPIYGMHSIDQLGLNNTSLID